MIHDVWCNHFRNVYLFSVDRLYLLFILNPDKASSSRKRNVRGGVLRAVQSMPGSHRVSRQRALLEDGVFGTWSRRAVSAPGISESSSARQEFERIWTALQRIYQRSRIILEACLRPVLLEVAADGRFSWLQFRYQERSNLYQMDGRCTNKYLLQYARQKRGERTGW